MNLIIILEYEYKICKINLLPENKHFSILWTLNNQRLIEITFKIS
jgi:hypothetical protein